MKKKTALRIQYLKRATDIRVEEAKRQSAMEVSGRIGRNLHDELSASLAGIVHNMEILTHQTEDEHLKERINLLKAETGRVYNSVRDKSHILYPLGADTRTGSFEADIRKITDFLLPDELYRTEIDIDKKIILHPDQQSEILSILKEAAVNILKHAKNATEVFVFLFEGENNDLQFQVGDNGKTFKDLEEGIGLKSIRERALSLHGNLKIETGGGTVFTITFPKYTFPALAHA